MRAAFLLLLLANLGFYAWANYYAPSDTESDPRPLARQIDPQKLKIVEPPEAAPRPPAAPDRPPAAPDRPPVAPPAPAPQATTAACLEWGSFTAEQAAAAQKALEPLALGDRLSVRHTEEKASWWVFMPPQGSREAALKKASELKDLGVDDYFIVQDEGPLRWSLSLGVFKSQDAALGRLRELRDKKVRSALVGPRGTVVPKVWLRVKGADPALQQRLKDIARGVEGSELRACDAG